jgi:hypothetical protein
MTRRIVAEARRTQLVSTYGVGSLFPAEDESFMICGLDQWPTGRLESAEVAEPRLARSLGVAGFRGPTSGLKNGDVPVVRFPDYHFCAKCGTLKPRKMFCSDTSSECDRCGRRITPSRFVACCRKGHIEDFPYFRWVHANTEPIGDKHELAINARGRSSSLSDVIVSCSCGVPPVSMAGSFGPKGVGPCRGRSPWLPERDAEECGETLRALQRGSSNVWFPIVRSAISIPPYSERAYAMARKYWDVFSEKSGEDLRSTIASFNKPLERYNVTVDLVYDAVLELKGENGEGAARSDQEMRHEEYQALLLGHEEDSPHTQFVCLPVDLDPASSSASVLGQLSRVTRLREVRVLESFSRIVPWAPGMEADRKGQLSATPPAWLPAIEVLGEGIFLRLDTSALESWENSEFAARRIEMIERGRDIHCNPYGLPPAEPLRARELLLHSFAHAILNELSLDAGYPAASLRERLYTSPGAAGILIYTASADSAGSLGGLAAQADPDIFEAVMLSALRRARWCSADPVCVESRAGGVGGLNLATCHACLLLPETSCERFNSVLDRAVLIGLPEEPDVGFFSTLS